MCTDLCNEKGQLVLAEQLVYAPPLQLELKWRCKDALAAKNLNFVHPELASVDAPALLSHTTLRALGDIVSEGIDSGTNELTEVNHFEQKLENLLRSKEFAEACAPSVDKIPLAWCRDATRPRILDGTQPSFTPVPMRWQTLRWVPTMAV